MPSPTPASNRRSAGGRGWMLASSRPTRLGHHPLFAAGVDEQQVLLPVVEEAEIVLRVARAGRSGRHGDGSRGFHRTMFSRALDDGGTCRQRGRPVAVHEGTDAVERLGGDAAAVAQPRCQLAVVDRAPAEGQFGEPGLAAVVGDFDQQFLGVHGRRLPWGCSLRSHACVLELDGFRHTGTIASKPKGGVRRQPQNIPPSWWDH